MRTESVVVSEQRSTVANTMTIECPSMQAGSGYRLILRGMLAAILTLSVACQDRNRSESRIKDDTDTQRAHITYVQPNTVRLTMAVGQAAVFYGTESVRHVEFETGRMNPTRLDTLLRIFRTGMVLDSSENGTSHNGE